MRIHLSYIDDNDVYYYFLLCMVEGYIFVYIFFQFNLTLTYYHILLGLSYYSLYCIHIIDIIGYVIILSTCYRFKFIIFIRYCGFNVLRYFPFVFLRRLHLLYNVEDDESLVLFLAIYYLLDR